MHDNVVARGLSEEAGSAPSAILCVDDEISSNQRAACFQFEHNSGEMVASNTRIFDGVVFIVYVEPDAWPPLFFAM